MNYIDSLLDRLTTYRLAIYYLISLLLAAVILGFIGIVHYSPFIICITASYATFACWIINKLLARLFKVAVNAESAIITGLILSLLIIPALTMQTFLFLSMSSLLAMASKYLITLRRLPLFNPAAFAVVITSIGAGDSAGWWIGDAPLAPFVIIGGLLLVRKVQRLSMVGIYFFSVIVVTLGIALVSHNDIVLSLQNTLLHSSLLFLGFVMLTEPLTSPVSSRLRSWYAILTGVLFAPQIHILGLSLTPEMSLLVGNTFSFFLNPKRLRVALYFDSRKQWGRRVVDFLFTPSHRITYTPGQYMEFTLPHSQPDSRGIRRYFTLASSPTEPKLHIGMKLYEQGSTYKQALRTMNATTPFAAMLPAGEFIMPKDTSIKLAFIAGGIGITPFRSMIKYLIDTNERRSISLLYFERDVSELAYLDVLEAGRQMLDINVSYILSSPEKPALPLYTYANHLSAPLIASNIPDYMERTFYISGPHTMVTDARHMLSNLGIPSHHILVDFFPGYQA